MLQKRPYLWHVWPRTKRFPRRRWHWWRVVLAFALVAGTCAGAWWVAPRVGCLTDLHPSPDLWSVDGECVGLSDGGYTFGRSALEPAFAAIARQNAAAGRTACAGHDAVTVGVLLNLTSDNAVGRAEHQLEGYAATQKQANEASTCTHPVRLLVGHTGARHQASVEVALRLAHSGVIAIAGMGLSDNATAAAANKVVGEEGVAVPMVVDLASAEGFDRDGSKSDRPDYSTCKDGGAEYRDGIGRDWVFRVAFRNFVQVERMKSYLGARPADFLVAPTDPSDPATCTQLPQYRDRLGGREIIFDPQEAAVTLTQAVDPICSAGGDVTVVYGARGRDAGLFLVELDRRFGQGNCTTGNVTVLEGSDGSRFRAVDPDQQRNETRIQALSSGSFRSGRIVLLLTPPADPSVPPISTSKDFETWRDTFVGPGLGFEAHDLDDGWAVNAHDALVTITGGLKAIKTKQPVTPSLLRGTIHNNIAQHGVTGAIQGPLVFDAQSRNRTGAPQLVRVCPMTAGDSWTTTVPVSPGKPGGRPVAGCDPPR